MATVLRAQRSLKKISKTKLITSLREVAQVAPPLARLSRDSRTEEIGEEDAKRAIRNITGEDAALLLTAAGEGYMIGHWYGIWGGDTGKWGPFYKGTERAQEYHNGIE